MLTRAQSGLCKRVPGLYGFALIFICLCSTYADQVKSLSKHMVGTKTRPSQKCQHCITLPACNDSTQAPFISLRRWVISSWWRVQINTWKKVERNENKKKNTKRHSHTLLLSHSLYLSTPWAQTHFCWQNCWWAIRIPPYLMLPDLWPSSSVRLQGLIWHPTTV